MCLPRRVVPCPPLAVVSALLPHPDPPAVLFPFTLPRIPRCPLFRLCSPPSSPYVRVSVVQHGATLPPFPWTLPTREEGSSIPNIDWKEYRNINTTTFRSPSLLGLRPRSSLSSNPRPPPTQIPFPTQVSLPTWDVGSGRVGWDRTDGWTLTRPVLETGLRSARRDLGPDPVVRLLRPVDPEAVLQVVTSKTQT